MGSWIKYIYFGPKIEIQLTDTEGDLTCIKDGTSGRYYKFIMSNKRKCSFIKNVGVKDLQKINQVITEKQFLLLLPDINKYKNI